MNISDSQNAANSFSAVRDHSCDMDTSDRDHLQDVLSNTSLHLTNGGIQEHPPIAILGTAIAVLEILLMLGLVTVSFVLPNVVGEQTVEDSLSIGIYTLMIYLHCITWFIVFMCDIVFSQHHRKLKMKGYLKFYRSIKYLQRHPFFVKSLFQSVILALTGHLTYNCKSLAEMECLLWTLPPTMWIQILTSVETAVMLIGLVIYICKVYYQNKSRLAPDDAEEQMLTSFQPHSLNTSQGVGYRADSYVDDIIEHQADKIRSLQEQNSVLNRKLYSLSCQQPHHSVQRQ